MGGPQVNGSQLLLAGETDFMMGYDNSGLKTYIAAGHRRVLIPVRTCRG